MTAQGDGRLARGLTLTVTYAIKVVGLVAAFNQLLLRDSPKPLPLAVAAFMMAGAQFSEGLVLAVIDRLAVTGPEQRRALVDEPPKPPELER